MKPESGPQFIKGKYPDTKKLRLPVEERFEKILANPNRARRFEKYLLDSFVVDVDDEATLLKLAKALYESEKRVAVERGYGADIENLGLSDDQILEKYKEAILDKEAIQRATLGTWLDYLKESQDYPMWFKYYVVRSLRSIGQFSRDEKNYAKRTEDTVAAFPELNSESLKFVEKALEHEFEKEGFNPEIGDVFLTEDEEDEIRKKVPEDKLQSALKGRLRNKRKEKRGEVKETFETKVDAEFTSTLSLNQEKKEILAQELLEILKTKDFAKLYAFAQVECAGNLDRESLQGEWVKYDKGSDYTKLEQGIKGKGTGWCTATGSAQNQIAGGDFYVFYTKNKAGIPTEPRIAIRMQGDSIGEIRGIDPQQELEPALLETAKEKYKDLPGAKKYEKADADMKRMTSLYAKCFSVNKETKENTYLKPELSKDELKFLYEIDSKIEGFGYDKDPRIAETIEARDSLKKDLASLFDCREDQISTNKEMALSGDIVFHHGGLNLGGLTSAEGLKLPESIGGGLYFSGLTSAEGLKLPESIGGDLDLRRLTSAEGLKLPESIGGTLDLRRLTSAEGLKLPESIGGDLNLISLTSAEGLKLPESIGGGLYFSGLTSAEGLKLPESIGGDLDLRRLTSAEGLKLPESIGGTLDLSSLTSAEGLKLPESIGGTLDLSSLTSAEGLKLPESIGGTLNLSRLTSAEGLKLPESIGGGLNLRRLTSAKGLKLPESIGGGLNFSSLTSAKGLKLPESIGGTLNLISLTSAEGLKLPESIGGDLYLGGLTSAKGLKLPESIGGTLNLISLTSAEGLKLPESIGEDLYFSSLTSAKGLKLPESIGGYLDLRRLTSAEKSKLMGQYPNLKFY